MRKSLGFTLIEVLIALLILSIAALAVLHAQNESISNFGYLENKIQAQWVASSLVSSAHLGLIDVKNKSELKGKVRQLNKDWRWTMQVKRTENKLINELMTTVFLKGKTTQLIRMVSYIPVGDLDKE
jgi:general secretion pathway protein I